MKTIKFKLDKIPFLQDEIQEVELIQEYKFILNSILDILSNDNETLNVYIYTFEKLPQIIYEIPSNSFIENLFLELKYFIFVKYDRELDNLALKDDFHIYRKFKMYPVMNSDEIGRIDKHILQENNPILPLDYNNDTNIYLLPIIATLNNKHPSNRWHYILNFLYLSKINSCIKIKIQVCKDIMKYLPYVSKCIKLFNNNYENLIDNKLSELYLNIISNKLVFRTNIKVTCEHIYDNEPLFKTIVQDWGIDYFEKGRKELNISDGILLNELDDIRSLFTRNEVEDFLIPPYYKGYYEESYCNTFIPKPFTAPFINENEGVRIGTDLKEDYIILGEINHKLLEISCQMLNQHVFICGSTGSAKTTLVKWILKNIPLNIRFMVIDPIKEEYKNLDNVKVIDFKKNEKFNPFAVPMGANIHSHAALVARMFSTIIPMTISGFDYFLGIIKETYKRKIYSSTKFQMAIASKGNDKDKFFKNNINEIFNSKKISSFYNQYPDALPSYEDIFLYGYKWIEEITRSKIMSDTDKEVKRYFDKWKQKMEISHPLIVSVFGDKKNTPYNKLIDDNNLVLNLFDFTDPNEKKAMLLFFIGVLNEVRRVQGESKNLKHITVLEEAHLIMPANNRAIADNIVSSADIEVGLLMSNLLAEIRSFGEGIIIAEQSPSKIISDVLVNTSVKIIKRLTYGRDIEYLAEAIGLSEKEKKYLLTLSKEESIVYIAGSNRPMYISYDYRTMTKEEKI